MPDRHKKDRLQRKAVRETRDAMKSGSGNLSSEAFLVAGLNAFGGLDSLWKKLANEWDATKAGSNSHTVIARIFAQSFMHQTQYQKLQGVGSEPLTDDEINDQLAAEFAKAGLQVDEDIDADIDDEIDAELDEEIVGQPVDVPAAEQPEPAEDEQLDEDEFEDDE